MPTTFRIKPREIQAVRWSGSNWHEMLEVFGKEVVSTDGKDLFVNFPNGDYILHPGEWLSTGLVVYDDAYLAEGWDRLEESDVNPATT